MQQPVLLFLLHITERNSCRLCVSIQYPQSKELASMIDFIDAIQLTQASIAILCISALLFMWAAFMGKVKKNFEYWSSRIMMHHKMDGQLMSHSQEEMALIGIFALFWIGEHLAFENDFGGWFYQKCCLWHGNSSRTNRVAGLQA